MAVIKVTLEHYLDAEHFVDVYEFVAAAGNVGHKVHLIIAGAAIQYLLPNIDGKVQRSAKMVKSLPFYDVESLWAIMDINLPIDHTQIPHCISCVDAYPTLPFDFEVNF